MPLRGPSDANLISILKNQMTVKTYSKEHMTPEQQETFQTFAKIKYVKDKFWCQNVSAKSPNLKILETETPDICSTTT